MNKTRCDDPCCLLDLDDHCLLLILTRLSPLPDGFSAAQTCRVRALKAQSSVRQFETRSKGSRRIVTSCPGEASSAVSLESMFHAGSPQRLRDTLCDMALRQRLFAPQRRAARTIAAPVYPLSHTDNLLVCSGSIRCHRTPACGSQSVTQPRALSSAPLPLPCCTCGSMTLCRVP